VSSAYKIQLAMQVELGKSLMNNKNKIGPNMDPWDTPELKAAKIEIINRQKCKSI
jgi:hypothetical protein